VILAWWSACLRARNSAAPQNKGYLKIPGTRPRTLVYGLTESPAGQLAWIGEHGVGMAMDDSTAALFCGRVAPGDQW
jgi:hypothetical protein